MMSFDCNSERPSLYERVDTQTDRVVLLNCKPVSAGRYSTYLLKRMALRAMSPNCSEQVEEE